jgi:hypothetical protein
MRPLTETEIRESIVNAAPETVEHMPMPGLHEVVWEDREYLGWRDPSAPQRGYLVAWLGDEPVGIVLRAAGSRLQAGAAICSLCNTPQPGSQVTMFSAALAGEKGERGDSVGTYICADLSCSLLIRIAPPGSDLHPFPDELVARRAEGLRSRVTAFTERVRRAA